MGTLSSQQIKSGIALNIEQMRHLISIGVNCDDASMVYHPANRHTDIFSLKVRDAEHRKEFWNDKRMAIIGEASYNQTYGRDVPAYTVDDIMRKLPQKIAIGGINHRIYFTIRSYDNKPEYQASYCFTDENGKMGSMIKDVWKSDSFLMLLYGILQWCILNKYI